MTFEVTSSHKIDIVNKNNYNGWLVINGLNKWIDFNLKDATGKETYKLDRINDQSVRITIENLDSRNEYVFESIGELNVVEKTYIWYLLNVTETYSSNIIEQSITTYSLNITKNSSIISTNATFYYNHSEQNVDKVSTALWDYYNTSVQHAAVFDYNHNMTVNWSINASTTSDFITYNTSRNDTVYEILLSGCDATVKNDSLNFSVKDDGSGEYITVFDFEGHFEVWDSRNTDYKKNFTFDWSNLNNNVTLCVYPDTANYVTDYTTLFEHALYDATNYIVAGSYLNASLQTLNIYLVNSTLSTTVTITLVDENDNELVDYIVEAHRYDLGTGNFTLVQTEVTGSTGKAQFSLDVSTDEYKFIVKNSVGTIVYTESKQKLIETTYTFRITLGTLPEFILASLYELDITLTGDRIGTNFTLDWSEINHASNSLTFRVVKSNFTSGPSNVYEINSTLNTGLLNYTITDDTTNRSIDYTAEVWLNSTKDGKFHLAKTVSLSFKKAWDIFGNESLFIAFLFIGTMTFIGLAVSAEIGIILTIAGMVIAWALGFYIIASSGMIALIFGLIILLVRLKKR